MLSSSIDELTKLMMIWLNVLDGGYLHIYILSVLSIILV